MRRILLALCLLAGTSVSSDLSSTGSPPFPSLSSSDSTTGARADTVSSPRRRITITPCVERPMRRMSSTGILMTVPPVEISIT